MVYKKAAFLLLNPVHVLLCTGACLGSRDTSVKVRCSTQALCVCRVCCLRSTSPCCWDVLWLQDSLKSPLTFLLSQPRLCTRVAVSLVALMCVGTITQAHANTEGSSCCVSPTVFLLYRSIKLLSMCNTQLGLRNLMSLQHSVQLILKHKYLAGMATLFLSLPV